METIDNQSEGRFKQSLVFKAASCFSSLQYREIVKITVHRSDQAFLLRVRSTVTRGLISVVCCPRPESTEFAFS